MNWIILTLGIVIFGLYVYTRYLKADRDLVKNDLELYTSMYTLEKERTEKLEKAALEQEKKAKDRYEKDTRSPADIAKSIRDRLHKKNNSI